jgi:hypothetical protein
MPIPVSCSCGAKLKAPDAAAGKKLRCPKCGAAVAVPAGTPTAPNRRPNTPPAADSAPATKEVFDVQEDLDPPAPAGRGRLPEYDDLDVVEVRPASPPPRRPRPEAEAARRKRSRGRDDEDDEGDDEERYGGRRRQGSDAPGVISLIFGCLSVVCLLMGCFTCGLTYWAALPFALIGAVVAFFARGNFRTAGVVLNVVALIPAVALVVVVGLLGVAGVASSGPQADVGKPAPGGAPQRPAALAPPAEFTVSAPQLYAEYADDAKAADARYNGHVLEVSGVVLSATTGRIFGLPGYVSVRVEDGDDAGHLDVYFREEAGLKALGQGSYVVARGRCRGSTAGSVSLEESTLVSSAPAPPAGWGQKEAAAERQRQAEEEAQAIPVEAQRLYDDYAAGPEAADARYKGRLLKVSGIVLRGSGGFGGRSAHLWVRGTAGASDVRGVLRLGQARRWQDLLEGRSITLCGRCQGLSFGSVRLDKCFVT